MTRMPEAGDTPEREVAEELFTAHIAELEEGGEARLEQLCDEHPEHADHLRELYTEWRSVDDLFKKVIPDRGTITADLAPLLGSIVGKHKEGSRESSSSSLAALEAIRARLESDERYDVQEEFARGGMGAILRVFDRNIRRNMAMKVMLDRGLPGETKDSAVNTRAMGRFLDEAQITGQLEHPGIVPVHELGVDESGQVYFTMKLVQGEELGDKYDKVFAGDEEWNTTRVLGVLLRVCEAMSFAHSKGVIHRDLKPANVMVGEFGEVYVMDWGLARILGREDFHGEELTPSTTDAQVVSDRLEQRDISPGSTMFTMEGDVMGTPSYMPPEQARGEIEEMDERSDVYAIGAMIYHLLSRHRPYQAEGEAPNAFTTLMRLLDGPPKPLHEFGLGLPPELEAICEKAMSRERGARYADMRELAADLRNYLEGRVVAAYQTGALAELRMWVRRNRSLANSLVAGVLVLVAGVVTSTYYWNESAEQAVRAEEQATKAELETAKVLRLGDARKLRLLWDEAEQMWPALPSRSQEIEGWLARANELLTRLPEHEEVLTRLREEALPRTKEEVQQDSEKNPLQIPLGKHRRAIPKFDALIEGAATEEEAEDYRARRARSVDVVAEITLKIREERLTWRFEDAQKEWWQETLNNLIEELKSLRDMTWWAFDEENVYRCGISEVANRLVLIEEIEELTLKGEGAVKAWEDARRSIADRDECPMYGGLDLAPQWGLLPIGRDPRTRLWEFAHVQTGVAPMRDEATGELVISEASGLVFVLVPAGSYWMGAQAEDEGGQNYDPEASPKELPVQQVTLDAFFLAKHEMSQAQWLRVAYKKPSRYGGGKDSFQDPKTGEVVNRVTMLHPVEQVTWSECHYLARSMGLELPTEAQWEYAARAGTNTPWWTGADSGSLEGAENLCDLMTWAIGEPSWGYENWRDGYVAHAPVNALLPNPWGFYHVLGNVGEWTLDRYMESVTERKLKEGTGQRLIGEQEGTDRTIRGPGWFRSSSGVRVSARYRAHESDYKTSSFGVRPARLLDS